MRWIRDPVKRLLISLVTAALIALSFGHGMDVQPLMGFWGILYPEYCFSSVEKAGDGMETRFTFRWLRTPSIGDRIGKKYQSECLYGDR